MRSEMPGSIPASPRYAVEPGPIDFGFYVHQDIGIKVKNLDPGSGAYREDGSFGSYDRSAIAQPPHYRPFSLKTVW